MIESRFYRSREYFCLVGCGRSATLERTIPRLLEESSLRLGLAWSTARGITGQSLVHRPHHTICAIPTHSTGSYQNGQPAGNYFTFKKKKRREW